VYIYIVIDELCDSDLIYTFLVKICRHSRKYVHECSVSSVYVRSCVSAVGEIRLLISIRVTDEVISLLILCWLLCMCDARAAQSVNL